MHKTCGLVLALLILTLAGCSSKPQDLILGRWEAADSGAKVKGVEFAKEGALRVSLMQGSWQDGHYKFLGDDKIEVEYTAPFIPVKMVQKFDVVVKKDELTATDEQGVKHEFKRVK